MRNDYSVRVSDSSKPLSAREKLMYADTTNATKLDEIVTVESPVTICPVDYVVLSVHNEKSENKDYDVYLLIDAKGDRYITGSTSFWNSFSDIWDTMTDAKSDGETEPFEIEIYKKESKNYKGKYFLSCSIV